MADYIYFKVEDNEVMQWKYFIPQKDLIVFNHIFRPEDKKIIKWEHNKKYFSIIYETTVSLVKKRLKEVNLSLSILEETISKFLGIPKKKICIAVIPEEDFYEQYADNDNLCEFWEKVQDDVENEAMYEVMFFYYILSQVYKNPEESKLILDVSQVVSPAKKMRDLREVNFLDDSFLSTIKIDRKYLQKSKIDFIKGNIDLVYINLFIALESSIKNYLRKKQGKIKHGSDTGINLEGFFKSTSLLSILKFITAIMGKKRINPTIENEIVEAYSVRNNIMHNGAKRFNRVKTNKAIEAVEIAIKIVNSLK